MKIRTISSIGAPLLLGASLLLTANFSAMAKEADKPAAPKTVKKPAPAKAVVPPAPTAAPAPTPVPAPAFVRELGGIEEYRLANGLQVLLFPDAAQSTTTVNITYRVGSRHESQGEFGMAHLLEHLLFKGTPTWRDIPDEYRKRGVSMNGTTTVDRTNYFASFNSNADTLDFALRLEADRMLNSFIAKADLDKEMTVVRNEFERGENQPLAVLSQRVTSVAYDWHPYGHSTIGARSDIENVPIEKLQAFYKRFYRPDNATLFVAGGFDKAATLKRIGELFGPLKTPAEPVPVPYTVEPGQDGERSVVVRRIGGGPALMAYYHVPAMAHPDTPALMVLGQLLTLQPSGQLYKELVESKLATSAGLFGVGGMEPGGIRAVALLAPGGDIAAVEKKLLDLVEGRTAKPFEESELARVREIATLTARNQMKRPETLIQQISSIGAGDWRMLFQLIEDLPKVTLADVERVRKAYLVPANRTLGRYLPATEVQRVEIPAAPAFEQRLADLKGPPKVEEGEAFEPTPANLLARTASRKLPSGIELLTLPKQTRGNTVQLNLDLRWGERAETFKHKGASLVGDLMDEGSTARTQQQLLDTLLRLKAGMSLRTGTQGLTLTLSAEKDTLIEALQVATEALQHPLFPPEAFDRIQRSRLAALNSSRQELGTLASEATRKHYNDAMGVGPGDPDYRMSLDERIAEVRATTLDGVKRFYEQYVSANEARVAVVGAIPEGLDAAIEQALGAWKKPAAPRFVRHVAQAKSIPPARFDVPARDKPNAQLGLATAFALNDREPDFQPLQLAVQVFGGGGLANRLSQRVRQQEGLSYGVGANLYASHYGNEAGLGISGTFAPANRDRMLAVVNEEIARMGTQGITEAELASAKKEILEGRRQSRANDATLARSLLLLAEDGETWADTARREAALQAVTPEQANAAWRRLVKPESFIITTVGDFK